VTATELAPPGAPPVPPPNPYVGPRSFRYGEPLFGRASELGEVLDLLVAQRILLLYSPSGAGKTSLLEAGLRPALEKNDFFVLPTARVSHEAPPSLEGLPIRNRYVLSTLLSLEEGREAELQLPPDELATISLSDYLGRSTGAAAGQDPCLFIDQFEELFTLDPTDVEEKAAFLRELGEALRDRGRWALLSMREDFVAQLDPHLELFSTLLRTRYRLDLLNSPAARTAIQKPAELAHVAFSDEAADRLVDDLRRVRVQRGSTVTEEPGPYVEPVQLQVVCRRLWSRLSTDHASIELDDVLALGDVDNALADYYDDEVTRVAKQAGVAERSVRSWFDDDLISAQGFRTQVLSGPGDDRAGKVLAELEDAHLIRADRRRGAIWYELAHDRMIEPVQKSNAAWWDAHLSTLQREAKLWEAQGRPNGLLLTGDVLVEAERWADEHPTWLVPMEREYLEACREERRHVELERRTAKRTRWLAIVAAGVSLLAIAGLVAALLMWRNATHQRERADKQASSASWTYAAEDASDERTRSMAWLYAYATLPQGEEANALLKRRVASVHHFLVTDPAYLATAADLSPDGTKLVRGVVGGRVEVVELGGSGRTILTNEPDDVLDVEFAPDGDLVAISGMRDGETGLGLSRLTAPQKVEPLPLPKGLSATGLVFNTSGEVLAAVGRSNPADENGALLLWDVPSGRKLSPPEDSPALSRVALSRDGTTLAGVDADGLLVVWRRDGSSWTDVTPLTERVPSSSGPFEFSPDGTALLVADEDTGALVMLSLDGGDDIELTSPPSDDPDALPAATVGAAFVDHGQLVTVNDDGSIDRWAASGSGYELDSQTPSDFAFYGADPLEFTKDATRLLSFEAGYAASVYSIGTEPEAILGYDAGPEPEPNAFFESEEKTFESGDDTLTMTVRSPDASFVWATDPSGQYVLGGSSEGTVEVWEKATGKPQGPPVVVGRAISGFVFGEKELGLIVSGETGDALLVYPAEVSLDQGALPAPDLDLELIGGGSFASIKFVENDNAIVVVEQDGSKSTIPLHPDYARLAREALKLAEKRGLALSDEECRRLVRAGCPSIG
jgi:WD40 repeat protein